MKNVFDVLLQKKLDIRRVQQEIAALHSVVPLLADEAEWLKHGIVVAPSLSLNPNKRVPEKSHSHSEQKNP